MGLLNRKKKEEHSQVFAVSTPQTAANYKDFASAFSSAADPGGNGKLYKALRESVPVIDAAVIKIVRLTGGFEIRCGDRAAQKGMDEFLKKVNVGGNSAGIDSFTAEYLDQLLTYGTAVGEMVVSTDTNGLMLYNASLDNISLKRSEKNSLDVIVCRKEVSGDVPVKNQNSILLSVLDPEAGQLDGNSLLKGLPFVSGILLQIFQSIGTNWERFGDLRYAVTYKPQNDAFDKAYAKERAMQIAEEWSNTMKSDTVRDFVAVGDVDIRVIGSDNQILDSEVPVRQMLEQIIAKTGLPPFMLGLSWSTTERMAQQQSDLLESELWHYRRILTPVIMKICSTYLRMNGYSPECEVVWDEISVKSETETAKANYYNAMALRAENESGERKEQNDERIYQDEKH